MDNGRFSAECSGCQRLQTWTSMRLPIFRNWLVVVILSAGSKNRSFVGREWKSQEGQGSAIRSYDTSESC